LTYRLKTPGSITNMVETLTSGIYATGPYFINTFKDTIPRVSCVLPGVSNMAASIVQVCSSIALILSNDNARSAPRLHLADPRFKVEQLHVAVELLFYPAIPGRPQCLKLGGLLPPTDITLRPGSRFELGMSESTGAG
jgi:hypothetical protein